MKFEIGDMHGKKGGKERGIEKKKEKLGVFIVCSEVVNDGSSLMGRRHCCGIS